MTNNFVSNLRYPDPSIEVLDDAFRELRLYSASIEQLHTGCRWAEGPVWFGDGRYLLWSDIPNNRIQRWDAASGLVTTLRGPANNANGLARDGQGRLLTCEHLTRRITRTEPDGGITVLADQFNGKRLNSPNDIVCAHAGLDAGSIWFTDPSFGVHGWWEGAPATQELPHAVYRLTPDTGALQQVITDLAGPNGLAFSPDGSVLYVVESRATPSRLVWAYDVLAGGVLANQRLQIGAAGAGALDGIAVDADGNVWCGWGSDGRPGASSEALNGVRIFHPAGLAIGHIHLPERCANVCFGGPHHNRLFMAASHPLHALCVNVQGAA